MFEIFSILYSVFSGLFIFIILVLIIYIIGLWKFFQKCGYNGWEAIIPIYNTWILVKISGLHSWYFFILMADAICELVRLEEFTNVANIASLVAGFFVYYNISKKFNKDLWFSFLLAFFPFIMIPILGFNNDMIYDDSVRVSPNGPIDENKKDFYSNDSFNNDNKNNFCRYCGNRLSNNANYCSKCGNKVNEE